MKTDKFPDVFGDIEPPPASASTDGTSKEERERIRKKAKRKRYKEKQRLWKEQEKTNDRLRKENLAKKLEQYRDQRKHTGGDVKAQVARMRRVVDRKTGKVNVGKLVDSMNIRDSEVRNQTARILSSCTSMSDMTSVMSTLKEKLNL